MPNRILYHLKKFRFGLTRGEQAIRGGEADIHNCPHCPSLPARPLLLFLGALLLRNATHAPGLTGNLSALQCVVFVCLPQWS